MADCNVIISIVAYQNADDIVKRCIDSTLNINLAAEIYIIDNSPTDKIRAFCNSPKIVYVFNNVNIGYGAGHNIAIKRAIRQETKYHLVLNPDIYFEKGTVEKLYDFTEDNQEVGVYHSPCSMRQSRN